MSVPALKLGASTEFKRRASSSWTERIESGLTSKAAVAVMALASVGLLLWILIWQLPQTSESQIVTARERLSELQQESPESPEPSPSDLTSLTTQVAAAERYLIPRREDVVKWVTWIERTARQEGWRAEVAVKPAGEGFIPVDNVNVLPAIMRLQTTPSTNSQSFQRLSGFLEHFEQLTQKVEIVSIAATAEKGVLSSALMELHFWTLKAHVKNSGK